MVPAASAGPALPHPVPASTILGDQAPGPDMPLVDFCATSVPQLGDSILKKLTDLGLVDVHDILYLQSLEGQGLLAGEVARLRRALNNWSVAH
jgi:hypothetical protein